MGPVDSLSKFVVWGIPHRCLNDQHAIFLERCLQSIRLYYQKHHIIVVDSDSPKKDHFPRICEQYNAVIASKINTNYECGAWKIVYEECKSADYYCFIHDSCYLMRPLVDTLSELVATYRCVPNTPTSWAGTDLSMREYVAHTLAGTRWTIPDTFWTLVGSIILGDYSIIKMLYDDGFFNVLPKNKYESQCWERRLGLCLCQDGFGDMLAHNQVGGYHGRPTTEKLRKNFIKRR